MDKKMKKTIIILSSMMLISFLLSSLFFFNSGVFDFNYGYVTGENAKDLTSKLNNFTFMKFGGENCEIINIDESIKTSLENVSSLEISSISTDIIVKPTIENEATFTFSGTGCDHKLLSSVKENKLKVYIKYPTYRSWFSNINNDLIFEIYLPQEYLDELILTSVSGEINFENHNLTSCNLESVSGDIILENVYCNESLIKTTSGEVEINGGNLDKIKTVSGDVDLEKIQINKDSRIETVSGEVTILPTNESNFKLVFNTVSGEKQIENIYGKDKNDLIVKTVSGDLMIY
jgi:DUF4097 and DUF4098 domain-containing protein YvlB